VTVLSGAGVGGCVSGEISLLPGCVRISVSVTWLGLRQPAAKNRTAANEKNFVSFKTSSSLLFDWIPFFVELDLLSKTTDELKLLKCSRILKAWTLVELYYRENFTKFAKLTVWKILNEASNPAGQ
jgi:hypothetical protein